ncbi:glutamate--cysteine ligase [Quadrisphaera sp. GCM10027208]|uniref:glutamate--cysteine ligase n=1 Tax=Quadrisphaera sp. GCM10027208 TaxID=3273423 RepID=UPI00361C0FB7
MTRQLGVEEELLLVDPATGRPKALAGAVLGRAAQRLGRDDGPGGEVEAELQQEQVESATRPRRRLEDVAAEVRRYRRAAADAAHEAGVELAALAVTPLPAEPTLTPSRRYRRMAREFGLTAAEQLSCGCHVHVEVADDEEGVAVLDRLRSWLSVLIAISANSPFYQGADSGYESFRTQVWGRWPSAGPYEPFGSADGYHGTIESLIASGTLLDRGMTYFDARLSADYPTVEVRVSDVCLHPDDTVLLAALSRGLVETAARQAAAGEPVPAVRTEILRAANWRAARSGLRDTLVDPRNLRSAPAGHVLTALVDHVSDALDDDGDLGTVRSLLQDLWERGNGAARQRETYERTGRLQDVVRMAVRNTVVG